MKNKTVAMAVNESIAEILKRGCGRFEMPGIGQVDVQVKARARRFIARWKGGSLSLTVPCGCRAADVVKALESMAPRLERRRRQLRYEPGSVMSFEGLNIEIKSQRLYPQRVIVSYGLPHPSIGVGTELKFDDDSTTKLISRALRLIAHRHAEDVLLPRARALAAAVGCRPAGWEISRGSHILGQCSSKRVIKLSSVCVLLPQELRDYIVWHELAHLSEMNHSARFHALCDRYCGGRERQFIAALRRFEWPIMR